MSKVWRYGDHVDTDVIIPARYLNISDFKELSEHAMEDIDTTFAPNVKPGDIIVAGRNFGCGSSREHAPIVIQQKGVACIIAESFARIFYRNAINIGLPVLEIGEEAKKIQAGDQVEVDFDKGEIHVVNKGLVIKTHPLPAFVRKIAEAGGLINYVKGVHA
ncbi:3-isopropylmalate dehydratase small subunit [Acidaminococcus fermentans]|uniref:3-isopropylmalate dehydratase small subunit n=1 Tax=Acidaminococcus fermentans TaxID=905 RepID=A0A1H2W6B2_ACIFE|nr:3-isopropylmalate dehydratase small subunit [Acidaminococcus fermentans]MCF0140241.1 3-isopropylmalate dehydratase small subunit [Acidaminococcus fermentans]MCI6286599.1 3-isopropylmalate dehydratase small subunit [Acidaminococcus fermentans]MDD7195867.1 3-isopropylmalate dehydratase small subunit [Acidaminococcus fermentans]MDY2852173.1 3-isopropylmalate dehydratase small subunit [Acidaminococcus fermentans]MDY4146557.1 3-isopropylmalate dehydratase small subunit [Acidaminococcus fermentan